ncbi:response regulator transcription factor [Luteolibacter sp. Populi]|uniref:response regulator transcription factor n=1 Tax=Luteolibacter sp. Populi TaxID=3230487 RepID=UPI003465857D
MSKADLSRQIVYVIDDDASLRTSVTRLLRTADHEVRSFASAGEFLLAREGPLRGCLLLDIRMPGGASGLEVYQALVRQAELLPVIFLTGHGDIPMSVAAIKAGAFDFLTKPVRAEVLLATVAAAFARDAGTWAATERRRDLAMRLATLTHAEYQVYRRVIAGQPNKQITAEVGSAERTVKAHRARVMTKMGALSLAELVHMADELNGPAFAVSH